MKLLPAWFLFILCVAARGDTLVLDDGTTLQGSAAKVGDQWVVTDADGHETAVSTDRVRSFQLTATGPGAAAHRLDELRRNVRALSNVRQIIDRYQKFIDLSDNQPAAALANADLALWQKRLDENYEKVGERWLTPDERDQLFTDEANAAAAIGELIRQQGLTQADTALSGALLDDPDDPSALYLRGLLLANRREDVSARINFEKSLDAVPDHGPTLNNLAVVLWRRGQYGAALLKYTDAMAAQKGNDTILSNVIEALHAMPPQYAGSPAVVRAAAAMNQQETLLEADQKKTAGLYRWGSTWVSAVDLGKLQGEQQIIASRQAALNVDLEKTAQTLASDQAWYQRNQAYIQLVGSANTGSVPPDYQQAVDDSNSASAAVAVMQDRITQIRLQMSELGDSYSRKPYSGAQKLFGPEGTPIRVEPPATQPSAELP